MPVTILGTRLVYFPVPKIACTSLKNAIYRHNVALDPAERGAADDGESTFDVHKVYRSQKFHLKYLIKYGFGNKWFCVVRDPAKRFVSGYRNRILHHGDLGKPDNPVFARLGLSHMPDINEFALKLPSYAAEFRAVRHHFAPICTYLGRKPGRYDKVFDISELEQLKAYVKAEGADLRIPHEQAGGPSMSVDDLDQGARAALDRFYEQDYRIWGKFFR